MSMAGSTQITPELKHEHEQVPSATEATQTQTQICASTKPLRVLACVLCQQRKVKCDRNFPCENCVRNDSQCVPAHTIVRPPRRRRFPERELLDRLRHYEGLLRHYNVSFEPLHPNATTVVDHTSPSEDGKVSPPDACLQVNKARKPVNSNEVVDLWQAISRVTLNADDDGEEGEGIDSVGPSVHQDHLLVRHGDATAKDPSTPKGPMESTDYKNDYLLFAPLTINADLSSLHPGQVQIFRLWQIYLDNVNPLLKVTHTPTLQPRIINAVSNLSNISTPLEALIFSIYCISVLTLEDDECRSMFLTPKKDLLAGYQYACQQALLKCSVWRSSNVDSLTAYYIYLVSVFSQTDVRCLSCMLAVAIRVAQRIGIHNESSYATCTVLEAEIRRRLWWSLVLFDYRICELTNYKSTNLLPTWDCKTPHNVNDFELRSDMKHLPLINDKPTEAVFALVRCELANFVRHSTFHLNLVNPILNVVAQAKDARHGKVPEDDDLTVLEKVIESKHLASCDEEDQLHYMTIWTTRGSLARSRLLAHYYKHSTSPVQETDAQRRVAISYALTLITSDTKLRTSHLTKGYLWLTAFYLPALGYLYILNDLRKWPASEHADKAWRAIADNYEAFTMHSQPHERTERGGIYLEKFGQVILQAWGARERNINQQQKSPEPPPLIVSDVSHRIMQMTTAPSGSYGREGDFNNNIPVGINDISSSPMPVPPMDLYGGGQIFSGPDPLGFEHEMPILGTTDMDMDQLWTEVDWRSI